MHVDLPKRTINQFKPDQQSRRHELKVDCSNIYTMLQPKSECTFFENETLAIYSYSSRAQCVFSAFGVDLHLRLLLMQNRRPTVKAHTHIHNGMTFLFKWTIIFNFKIVF